MSTGIMVGPRSRVVTLRMDSKTLDEMERRARLEGISTNAFMTRILKSHAEWERIAATLELMPVQKPVVRDFLEHVPEDKLIASASRNADDSLNRLFGPAEKPDIHSFLEVVRTWLNESGFAFSERMDEEGNMVLVAQHGMGRRWSDFSNAYYGRVLQKLGYAVSTESRENLWVSTIRMN